MNESKLEVEIDGKWQELKKIGENTWSNKLVNPIANDIISTPTGLKEDKFIFAPPPGICEEHNMSETRYFFYQFMHSLFWRTLCPQPDGKFNMRLRGWPYNFTGKIAHYFHKKVCTKCQ